MNLTWWNKYRSSFCLAYNQVYIKNEPLKINEVSKFLISRDMFFSYPNLCKLYKLYYTLPVSNATAKKVFADLNF